jgi:NAD(P)-dependent dehydrogenase (short-subunit alcohol dehydrogenase family)
MQLFAAGRPALMAPGIPMARAVTLEEVVWLISRQASYVTGAIIPVGGGR